MEAGEQSLDTSPARWLDCLCGGSGLGLVSVLTRVLSDPPLSVTECVFPQENLFHWFR